MTSPTATASLSPNTTASATPMSGSTSTLAARMASTSQGRRRTPTSCPPATWSPNDAMVTTTKPRTARMPRVAPSIPPQHAQLTEAPSTRGRPGLDERLDIDQGLLADAQEPVLRAIEVDDQRRHDA